MNIEWTYSNKPLSYPDALADMEERVAAIIESDQSEQVWLLEHPPLYTAGTSAKATDLLNPQFPVYETGRGGEYTYHGPGQRVAYVMLNLEKRNMKDLRLYIAKLEQWIIEALAELGIKGGRRDGRIGIWVEMDCPFIEQHPCGCDIKTGTNGENCNTGARPYPEEGIKNTDTTVSAPFGAEIRDAHQNQDIKNNEKKIAAIGVRVRKWVTFHGVSINVNPDLSHFQGIVPCGIKDYGVTSLAEINPALTMDDLDKALKTSWKIIF